MPLDFNTFAKLWNTSAPIRSASRKVLAPTGLNHELLDINVFVGVLTTVDDVHHW